MPTLNTGLIIAGAYADKARRVLMAQVRGQADVQEVVRASAELNKLLFKVVVNELKAGKGDVVRIVVDYEVEGGQIRWNLDTLRVELFKRVPDEEVKKRVDAALARALGKQ